jgi:hypothetical protein
MENASKNIPPELIDEYRAKAEYLIDRGYVNEKEVDKLAITMYNSDKKPVK